MNRNLDHSGNLIARNRISLKGRILHQKVSIFQFVFIRRIASSPNESVRSISYLSLKGHKHRFHPVTFLFFENIHKKRFWKHFSLMPLDVRSISTPNSRRRKGNCRLMEGNNADRSCVQSKTSSWMKNENKKKLIPESGQKLRVSELFNCLI